MDKMRGRLKVVFTAMFLAIGMLVISNYAIAQGRYSALGIRAGTNWVASSGERDIFADENMRGNTLGGYATLNFTNFFGIQPEILFSRRSEFEPRGTYVYPGTEEVFPYYMHSFDYLDIPLFMRFNITEGLHVLLGPQFSYFLGSRERYIGYGGREFLQLHEGGSYFNFSGSAGIAYEFRAGLNIGIRYGYGLGRIHSLTNFDGGNFPHQTQGMLTIGHTFGGRVKRRKL